MDYEKELIEQLRSKGNMYFGGRLGAWCPHCKKGVIEFSPFEFEDMDLCGDKASLGLRIKYQCGSCSEVKGDLAFIVDGYVAKEG